MGVRSVNPTEWARIIKAAFEPADTFNLAIVITIAVKAFVIS
jgi:hypothetical protein